MAENYVIDASMGVRGGMFCFCPVEQNDAGEITAVVTGLSYLGDTPPGKWSPAVSSTASIPFAGEK